ncbi:ComEC/Rec2 family competence protein [Clostridium butyricum]|uniref:ComE operon protein 3 n=2 Tax=Clostridium butyricum TaxID=1492 RepID=C4IHU5_CLOBU|nr:MBL fold metallo-hydrolase [Clostridium butyricum]APF23428.1 beta-lactamase superfamily domain protein [Clostridium butyricum]EEP55048.1 ComE operon protein 3 [Clostridium butyricum E4 str. BoNT E BL5262]MBZ5745368.1 MBL fold metallo-hydrolase [Clostridium butyricum]MCQ2012448.1 MBL fold metallo-hydrolase [Clostridium butyricum]NFL32764.1 MBL fold metallo-hydrolase [Clostridium butyricum]
MFIKIKKRHFKHLIIFTLLLLLCFFSSLLTKKFNSYKVNPNLMYVHYINVDQGDAILIQVNNKNLLIDSGPKSHKKQLVKFLNDLNISKLDYVIATHPHEDHIGNMNTVLNSYKVQSFYAPKVYSYTKSFEQMIDSLKSNNLKINPIKRGCNTINLGFQTNVEVFSPINDTYDNENNYSPVIKISFGNNSFLFTGDAEKEIEDKLILLNDDLKADILKVSHHGSSSSTSDSFLNRVSPKYAIISVGKNNIYDHPNDTIISKLNTYNIDILRTDIQNNITLISDGTNISYKYY